MSSSTSLPPSSLLVQLRPPTSENHQWMNQTSSAISQRTLISLSPQPLRNTFAASEPFSSLIDAQPRIPPPSSSPLLPLFDSFKFAGLLGFDPDPKSLAIHHLWSEQMTATRRYVSRPFPSPSSIQLTLTLFPSGISILPRAPPFQEIDTQLFCTQPIIFQLQDL